MLDLPDSSVEAAKYLLGHYLVREIGGQKLVGKIVETEAYDQKDAASHSYRGKTPRTDVMFGPAGRAHIYFTYGMHYCFNVVVGPKGYGSAVLIRALEPVLGIEIMEQNRRLDNLHGLTNGPAKLCQALDIDKVFNGHDLTKPPLHLRSGDLLKSTQIVKTTRIGISQGTDRLWRFYIKDNPFVSKR